MESGSQSEVWLAQPCLKKQGPFSWLDGRERGWRYQSPDREGRRLRHRGHGSVLQEEAWNSPEARWGVGEFQGP